MDNKIKLNLKEKRVVTRKIGDQSFKIKPFISLTEKDFILNKICESFSKRIEEGEDISALIMGVQADLDVLVCSLCTNIDFDGVDYEEFYNSGIIPIIKDNICNYRDLENSCNNMIEILKISSLLPDLSAMSENFDMDKLLKQLSPEEIDSAIKSLKGE